jgi:hypothetical protein
MNNLIVCDWRLEFNSGDHLEVDIAVFPFTLIRDFWLATGKNLCEANAGDPVDCTVQPAMMVMSVKAFKKCLRGGS